MSTHHHAASSSARIKAIIIAVISIGIVIAIGAGIGDWISTASAPAQKSPFSVGISEGGAKSTGLAAIILDIQARFSTAMTSSLSLFRDGQSGLLMLIGLGFAYGVFHAAGPGHGKAVIAAYAFSHEKSVGRTIGMASAAAALQTFVAIAIVTILSVIINVTAPTMRNATHLVELLSFSAIALVGLVLLWDKSKSLARSLGHTQDEHGHNHHDHRHHNHHHDNHHHGHSHAPIAPSGSGLGGAVSAIIAAGIRPCSGSILILVFALSQSLFYAGVLAAIAIGIGTAITTCALAVFAILAKQAATKLAEQRSATHAALVVNGLEVLAAAFVFALGASLLWASQATMPFNG